MEYEKKWYMSKTVWAASVALIIAALTAAFGEGNAIASIVIAVASAAGVYGRVTANSNLTT